MLIKVKPKKISVYTTNGKMTCAQVRKKTGCDICINGTFYNFNTMKPVCDVKVDGVILSDSKYGYWGYGWNDGQARATMSNDMYIWKNYISAVALLKDGKRVLMSYGSDVGGKRGRSAIGYTKDGTMVVYCYKDGSTGACTPEKLADKMLSYGCVDALCLDGGGSVQIDCDQGKVTSSRKVANFICIWTTSEKKTMTCPYKEPKTLVKRNSIGEGAKWVQWHLQQLGLYTIKIDGIFGKGSVNALLAFQKSVFKNSKDWDGICGAKTREELIKAVNKK